MREEHLVSAKSPGKGDPTTAASTTQGKSYDATSDVLVCVDDTDAWKSSVPHAQAIAASFGGKVVLIKVFERSGSGAAPIDPVDWEIRKKSSKSDLEKLAENYSTPECEVCIKIVEGNLIDQLCACATQNPQDITVLLRSGHMNGWRARSRLGHLVDLDIGSVLMIPPDVKSAEPTKYDCIFVPLDGSKLAEAAIPSAIAIAKAHSGEVLICHVTPDTGVTIIGPSDEDSRALQEQIQKRNRKTGKGYLKRIGGTLRDCGVPISTVFIEKGDVRRSLLDAAREHGADLLVIASHGQSGQTDVATGHVTGFILDHSAIPVLMVRKQHLTEEAHAFSDVKSSGVRVPNKMNDG
jgi:nucleotide-binding universal stress UspA family protein